MKVVLAGINETNLARAEGELRAAGAIVFSVPTDVSKAGDVEALAHKTLKAFGGVHLLFNNAGVGTNPGTPIWESTTADWEWVIGVNLWGVIHGIRVFVPLMLEQNVESRIVNVASVAGLISGPRNGIYKLTKHGVVSLSETLHAQLAARGSHVKVSVLCPGYVQTRIWDAERNRPRELKNLTIGASTSSDTQIALQDLRQAVESGISPEQVAEETFTAIRSDKFYILTQRDIYNPAIQKRMEDILQERHPG